MTATSYGDNSSWTETAAWWTDPRLAYAAGLAHGAQLERERQEAVDDAVHRAAVQKALQFIEAVDCRAHADSRRLE